MVREIVKCDTLEKRLLMGLFVLLVAGLMYYVYLVNLTVVHVVERKVIEQDLGALSSEVSNLELSYIELKNGVTLDYAYGNGFHDISGITYVSRGQFALGTGSDL